MARKSKDWPAYRLTTPAIVLIGFVVCIVVYGLISVIVNPQAAVVSSRSEECCKGIQRREMWGAVVRSGSELKFNSSEQCCQACKNTCTEDGHCPCNSWVFCGNKDACKHQFGECWLKKQDDKLIPSVRDDSSLMWTSGLIYGEEEGIIGMETKHGTIHIRLLPDCAPRSVDYVLEILKLKFCGGCQIYRAEPRGDFWDSEGDHIKDALNGPPYGLIQGTIDADGSPPTIPKENPASIRRGSVAWVDSGPEFFISLANHDEWVGKYTVFGTVLREDMWVVEKIAALPTKAELWNKIEVAVLDRPVPISIQRRKTDSN